MRGLNQAPRRLVRARSGDPRGTKQIRNESSRDQRAVKTNFAACQCDTATGSKKKGGQFGCGERLGFGLTLNRFCPTMPADPGGPIPALTAFLAAEAHALQGWEEAASSS